MVTPAGAVTTLAGKSGVSGTNDGVGLAAGFNLPYGLAFDTAGLLYLADSGNDRISTAAEFFPPTPQFSGVQSLNKTVIATLTNVVAGTVAVLQGSTNFQDWSPVATNVVTSATVPLSRTNNTARRIEALRAVVQ